MLNISIVTGTLNRQRLLPNLINNTVTHPNIEVILVDGGSTDNTISYIKELNHPQIQLIEVGKRSPYPHYMNLGIQHAKYDLICQWNDDVLLTNTWDEVFNSIDDQHDIYLFSWFKSGSSQFHLLNNSANNGEVVMNYGVYTRKVFEIAGMYNSLFQYYCADGEMCLRAYKSGFKIKNLHNIKVEVLDEPKKAISMQSDIDLYYRLVKEYYNGNINTNVEKLKCKN